MVDFVEAAAAAAVASASVPDDPSTSARDPHPLHVEVESWFASHFHNSIVARDTETFNHVRAAVDALKVRLVP